MNGPKHVIRALDKMACSKGCNGPKCDFGIYA